MKCLLPLLAIFLPSAVVCGQPAATPRTDEAAKTIERQVQQLSTRRPALAREYLFSVAAMNYVQSRLSSLNYSVRKTDQQPLPKNVEQCLEMKAGICGNHIATFLELAQRLKIRVRPVEFYIHGATPAKNHNHICVEVYYRQQWRFVDVTWGTFFRKPAGPLDELATIAEIQATAISRQWAVTNETDLWYQQWKSSGLDPLEYIDHPQVDTLRGRNGTIRLRPQRPGEAQQQYGPLHQPNFVGRNDANPDYGPIVVQLTGVPVATRSLQVQVLGVADSGQLVVLSGKQRFPIPFSKLQAGQSVVVDLPKRNQQTELTLLVESSRTDKVGYLVYQQITLD